MFGSRGNVDPDTINVEIGLDGKITMPYRYNLINNSLSYLIIEPNGIIDIADRVNTRRRSILYFKKQANRESNFTVNSTADFFKDGILLSEPFWNIFKSYRDGLYIGKGNSCDLTDGEIPQSDVQQYITPKMMGLTGTVFHQSNQPLNSPLPTNYVCTRIGVKIYNNGNIYIGKWRNDQKHGEGIMIYTNGDIYVGSWMNDKKHGEGYILDLYGNKSVGKWENDKNLYLHYDDDYYGPKSKKVVSKMCDICGQVQAIYGEMYCENCKSAAFSSDDDF